MDNNAKLILGVGAAIMLIVILFMGIAFWSKPSADEIQQAKVEAVESSVKSKIISALSSDMEKAYMYGQIDAINGDIKIGKKDSIWHYTDSPWDGAKPEDIPSTTLPVKGIK